MRPAISTHTPLAGRDWKKSMLRRPKRISTHTPLAGRDARNKNGELRKGAFQLTRPLRGATLYCWAYRRTKPNFNSHAPCGARLSFSTLTPSSVEFQLTRPLRGATGEKRTIVGTYEISTHTPLAGRDEIVKIINVDKKISTHTPLAGRDDKDIAPYDFLAHFNSHAPCGARR